MPVRDVLAHEERGVGEALVLVHGHPFNRSMWNPQIESLSRTFRVVAVDLPGFGESPPRSEVMTMRAFAEAVVELLDHLGVERSIVIGLSMGGLVAMELGLGYPDPASRSTTATRSGVETDSRLTSAGVSGPKGGRASVAGR